MKQLQIRQSNNKHQWFVEELIEHIYKIIKIFYTEEDCKLFIENKYSM